MSYFSKKKIVFLKRKSSVFFYSVESKTWSKLKTYKDRLIKPQPQATFTGKSVFTKLIVQNCLKLNNLKSKHLQNYFMFKVTNSKNYKLLYSALFFNFLEKNYDNGPLASGVVSSSYLNVKMSINDYFFSSHSTKKWNKNSRWYSMEEIISHFIFYSEGFSLPSGFSYGSVEAPKGHLGVSMVSQNSNKPSRARIKSSIQNMMGQVTQLVEGTSLGDFVVIVSGSYVVVGEVDR